jgi:hypothetical protein
MYGGLGHMELWVQLVRCLSVCIVYVIAYNSADSCDL